MIPGKYIDFSLDFDYFITDAEIIKSFTTYYRIIPKSKEGIDKLIFHRGDGARMRILESETDISWIELG